MWDTNPTNFVSKTCKVWNFEEIEVKMPNNVMEGAPTSALHPIIRDNYCIPSLDAVVGTFSLSLSKCTILMAHENWGCLRY